MTPGTLILLHSPLTTASAWGSLPAALGAYDVVVPEVSDDDRPPYAARYVARAALEIAAAGVKPPLVLVAHGAAGPLLPPIGAAQRAAHRLVGGYVFLDARLPGPPGTVRGPAGAAGDPAGAARGPAGAARGPAGAAGGPAGAARGPSPAARLPEEAAPAGVTLRTRGPDFFAEEPPMPQDWPNAPCGYLRTSGLHEDQARQARMRGWTVAEHLVGHFAAVEDPQGTAEALGALMSAL